MDLIDDSDVMPEPEVLSLPQQLATLKPVLASSTFIFATFPPNAPVPPSLPVQMLFREAEGMTLVTTRNAADAEGIDYWQVVRLITLEHTKMQSMDFMAFVTNRLLKDVKIDVNFVSGYHHDYCFVGTGYEEQVMRCLQDIANEAQEGE
ncbi:hypothetical protein N0V91_001705 [Didymella pomorum]|jgi:hypothetical protein|uniref:DUF2241 domain-containing protein n=1 Tax=Didymella pomorum TaxID=749634 RepID=A0A9W9DAS5_9PLEO|nr:hypothetical protein N0V91_001705 [Didymella pomorum]